MIVLSRDEAQLIDFIALNIPADVLNQEQWALLSMLSARILEQVSA